MRFYYPLGLLGLIGVPVIILIYILKNKFTEQTVNSTYIWTLSERFLKKRLPISKLAGLLSLLLQLFAVIIISLSISHPVLLIKNAAHDYYFVLDCSGSMNVCEQGGTRFDKAKSQINKIIKDSMKGSSYTLVCVGATADVSYENITDKQTASQLLGEIKPSYANVPVADATEIAQAYFNGNTAAKTYVFTDKNIAQTSNVNLINVSDGLAYGNVALSSLDYYYNGNNCAVITGGLISYGEPCDVTVNLYCDGGDVPFAAAEVSLIAPEPAEGEEGDILPAGTFEYVTEFTEFKSFTAEIEFADALQQDNELVIYSDESEAATKTLIVSARPFFIDAAFAAKGIRTTVMQPKDYNGQSGYNLYVFDSYVPLGSYDFKLPQDGAVWFFNPVVNVGGTGFSVQTQVTLKTEISSGDYASGGTALTRSLMQNVLKSSFSLSKYQQCKTDRVFSKLIECNGNPIIFAGTNEYGNREIVFSFDVHDGDFALITDYTVIMNNLIDYAFPSVFENRTYACGEALNLNMPSNSNGIQVLSPSGRMSFIDPSVAMGEYMLSEVGEYTVSVRLKDGARREYHVFAAVAEGESDPTAAYEEAFSVTGVPTVSRRSGIFDHLIILFVILGLAFGADWVVYCYEQYQLR